MNMQFERGPIRRWRAAGFSLVEVLVVVGLLVMIVYALISVFDRTQRALLSSTAQVDVLEPGRAALDLVGRDLEEMAPTGLAQGTNLLALISYPAGGRPLLCQDLSDGSRRTNFLEEVFFMVRSNNFWLAKGFFVASPTNPTMRVTNGIGTLYRFLSVTRVTSSWLDTNWMFELRRQYLIRTNANPVADGVIHFQIQPYDRFGVPFQFGRADLDTNYFVAHYNAAYQAVSVPSAFPNWGITNVVLHQAARAGTNDIWATESFFLGDALPASVDLELALVEPQVVDRYRAIPYPASLEYLERQAGAVHLFKRRIPIRNTQP